jgi:hypothetical protein
MLLNQGQQRRKPFFGLGSPSEIEVRMHCLEYEFGKGGGMRPPDERQRIRVDLPQYLKVMAHIIVVAAETAKSDDIKRVRFEVFPVGRKRHALVGAIEQGNLVAVRFKSGAQTKNTQIRSDLEVASFTNGHCQQDFHNASNRYLNAKAESTRNWVDFTH